MNNKKSSEMKLLAVPDTTGEIQVIRRDKMGRFLPGTSPNPAGRPTKRQADLPVEAKDKMVQLAIEYATNPEHPKHHDYLMKFMDKLFPSLRAENVRIEQDPNIGIIILPSKSQSVETWEKKYKK